MLLSVVVVYLNPVPPNLNQKFLPWTSPRDCVEVVTYLYLTVFVANGNKGGVTAFPGVGIRIPPSAPIENTETPGPLRLRGFSVWLLFLWEISSGQGRSER